MTPQRSNGGGYTNGGQPTIARDRHGVLIIADVAPDRIDELRRMLRTVAFDLENNALFPFVKLPTVHFARIALVDADTDTLGATTPACLIYEANFDSTAAEHLDDLVSLVPAGIDVIFGCCRGYASDAHGRRAWLEGHCVPFGALYQATHHRSVKQIRAEAALRERLEAHLDELQAKRWIESHSATELRAELQEFVATQPDLQWTRTPAPTYGADWHVVRALVLAATGLIGAVTLPLWGTVGVLWFLAIRRAEAREKGAKVQRGQPHTSRLTEHEDRSVQNQLLVIGTVKPTLLRRWTLAVVLFWFNYLVWWVIARSRTFLGVETIHFARFVTIGDGRRLLFLSNYDGSWESYLGDFVDILSFGINAVWSNADGFPSTRWLFFGGARNEQEFKALVRDHQRESQVWYGAYGRLTVRNINDNTELRRGLWGPMDEAQTISWLRLL